MGFNFSGTGGSSGKRFDFSQSRWEDNSDTIPYDITPTPQPISIKPDTTPISPSAIFKMRSAHSPTVTPQQPSLATAWAKGTLGSLVGKAVTPLVEKVTGKEIDLSTLPESNTLGQKALGLVGNLGADLPLWLAGDALLAKPLAAIAKTKPIAKAISSIPKIAPALGTGIRAGSTYGLPINALETAVEGDGVEGFADRLKDAPLMALGGTALHGAGQLAVKGAKTGVDYAKFNKLTKLPETTVNPLEAVQNAYKAPSLRDAKAKRYSELFSGDAKPLATEQNVSIRRPLARQGMTEAELLAQRQLDAQSVFGDPIKGYGIKQTIKPGQKTYEARQAELSEVFKDFPIGSVDTPVARKTLQEGIDSSLGIGGPKGEYGGLDAFGKPLKTFKKNTDTQDAITEISTKMTKQLNDIAKSLKQVEGQTGIESIRKKVKDMGGIRQANDGIFEERRVIPNWIRNDKGGRPLDEVADTLGMSSDELLAAISDSNRKIRNYAAEAQAIANKDPEYQALSNTLETLRGELPGKKTLNSMPELKPREITPKSELIQPQRLGLSGSFPVNNPVNPPIRPPLKPRALQGPQPMESIQTERVLPKQEPLIWTNREGMPQPAPIRPTPKEQTLTEFLRERDGVTPNGVDAPVGEGMPSQPISRTTEIPKITETPSPIGVNAQGGNGQVSSQKLNQIPVTEPSGVERLSLPDTLANNPNTSKEFSNRLKQTGYDYGSIHNKDTMALAEDYVRKNHDSALSIVLSDVENTAEKNTVALLLAKEAEKAKNWELAAEIVSKISNNAKTQGQANQALSMWGKSEPATIIKLAEKTVNKARTLKQVAEVETKAKELTTEMNKVNSEAAETVLKEVESGKGPKVADKPIKTKPVHALSDDLIGKLDAIEASARERLASRKGNLNSLPVDLLADYAIIGTTKIAKGAIKFSNWSTDMLKEFGDDIKPHLTKIWDQSQKGYDDFISANGVSKEILPEEILANRIKGSLASNSSPKEKDAIQMMVNTLHKVAKESPLPNSEKIPSNPLEFVADAIRNRGEYKEVWAKAKEIIEKKYADDPDALALLDDYLAKGIDPTFAEGQLNSSVSKGLKEMNVSVRDIVTQHYSVGNKIREDLVTQLVEKAGLSGEDAAILEKHVVARIAELTKTKKEQILKQMFKPKIARNRKELSQKIIELSNVGGFHDQKFKMLVGEKLGVPTLDEATIKAISEQSNKIQSMPEGEEKIAAVQAMMQMIANKVPSTMAEKILGVARMAMLGNTKTMTINTVSNAVFGAVDNVSNLVGTPLDKALGKFSIGGIAKKRTTTIPSVTGQFKSTVSGIKDVVNDFSGGLKASDLEGKSLREKIKLIRDHTRDPLNGLEGVSQYDLPNKKIFQGKDIISRVLNRGDNLVKTGLTGGDHPFYKAAKEESLRQQMKLANVTEPTEEMVNQAVKTANERTYRDVNTLSGAFKSIQEGLNNAGAYFGFGTKDIGVGNIAMPFIKTPANLMARAIDYSPLGFNRAVKELLHIKKGTFDQKAFVDSVSRGVTGTALIMVGYDLAKKGIITGRGNKDKDISTFERSLGKNDYAYKVGDTYHTYDWMQPGSIAIAIGADVFFNGKDRKDAQGVIMDGIVSGGGTLFKQSVVQGLSRFAGGYTPVESIATSIKNAPTMFIPALLKQSAQKSDPITRSTYDPSEDKTILNTMKNKVPGLSKNLEPQVDTFGEIKKNFQGDNSITNSFFKIGKSTEFKPNAIQQEILRIYKSTGDTDVFPKVAPKSLTVKGEKITLTPKEITKFQQTMGQNTMSKLNRISGSNDKAKAESIKNSINASYEKARKELLDGRK